MTATFKEKANDNGSSDPNPDLFSWSEDTILEPGPDFSQSVAFLGGSTLLETLPGHRGQSSVFRIPVVAAVPGGFELTTLEEFSSGDTGYFCPTGFACFGQSVATSAPGIFSASNLANLITTMDLALLPKGVTEKSLRVHHGSASFTTACGGALFTTPARRPVSARRDRPQGRPGHHRHVGQPPGGLGLQLDVGSGWPSAPSAARAAAAATTFPFRS